MLPCLGPCCLQSVGHLLHWGDHPAPHTPQLSSCASSPQQLLSEAETKLAFRGCRAGAVLSCTKSEVITVAALCQASAYSCRATLLLPCLQMLFNTAFSSGTVLQCRTTSHPPSRKEWSLTQPTIGHIVQGPSLLAGCMLECLVCYTEQNELT